MGMSGHDLLRSLSAIHFSVLAVEQLVDNGSAKIVLPPCGGRPNKPPAV
jgi:hypothetical protein